MSHKHANPTAAVRGLWRRRWGSLTRRQRWFARTVIGLPALTLIAFLILGRSPLTRVLVLPRLGAALGLRVDADSVWIGLDGKLRMNRARFRVPGVAGPAGEFLSVDRLAADVSWWSTLTGSPSARGIDMEGPVVRVSQSEQGTALNIDSLSMPRSVGHSLEIPAVVVTRGSVELGEHAAGLYRPLKRIDVAGSFGPLRTGGYGFDLKEIRPQGREGIRLDGTLVNGAMQATMLGFVLDEWTPEKVPRAVRDRFAELDLKGQVSRATISYTPATGVVSVLDLAGVEMNLLGVPNQQEGPEQGRLMRMHGVTGPLTITPARFDADVKGLIEDLPYTVSLKYHGVDANAPFECRFESEGFRVDRNPRLLPYVSDLVRYRLQTFSSPTAILTTRLEVTRGAPTESGPAPVVFSGAMEFEHGEAAYYKFPYPFKEMAGLIEFDNSKVRIVRVTGRSDSGARLFATGLIAPPDATAEANIDVTVTGAPIDDLLAGAFGKGREQIISTLFNKDRYRQLLDKGLVLTPAGADALRAELDGARARLDAGQDDALRARVAELERRLRAPVFEMGGLTDVTVHVHRPAGVEVEWDTDIEIRLDRAGLVPRQFPVPVEARNVIARVDGNAGRIVAGTFEGLRGGAAQVEASFNLPGEDEPIRPVITIVAGDVPLDDLLINALPGEDDAGPDTKRASGGAVKRALRALNVSGVGGATVHIAPRGTDPDAPIGYDVDATISGARAAPALAEGAAPGPACVVADMAGTLRVNEATLDLDIAGRAGIVGDGAPDAELADPELGRNAGSVHVAAHAEFKPDGNDADITVTGTACEVRAPFEQIVRVFSPAGADAMDTLRRERRPAGHADARTIIVIRSGAVGDVTVALSNITGGSFDALDGRVELGDSTGEARISTVGSVRTEFDAFAAPVSFAGAPVGAVTLTGGPLVLSGEGGGAAQLRVDGGRFESPLLPAILRRRAGDAVADAWASIEPAGEFEAELTLGADVKGRVAPKSFFCRIDGTPVGISEVEGAVELDGRSGLLRGLTGRAPGWSILADGAWTAREGGYSLRTELTVRGGEKGEGLTPDLLALIPPNVRSALTAISLGIDGPFQMERATLSLSRGGTTDQTRFTGSVEFTDARVDAGAVVTECTGRAEITAERSGTGPAVFGVGITADRFRVANATGTDGRVAVKSGTEPGEVLLPIINGRTHGGRFSGRVRLAPVDESAPDVKEYTVDFRLAGVRLSPLLAELMPPKADAPDQTTPAQAAAAPALEEEPADDQSRGVLDGELSLGGLVGVPQTRRGRGSFRIAGGRILNMPLVMPLIEVSNLQLPSNERLDYAQARLFINGGLISFEELAAFSRAVAIVGYGTMTWPGKQLDMRFDSRSTRPIPVLSWMVQGIRDQLVTTSVTGKLGEQTVKLQQFPGTRRILGRAVGAEESEESRRLSAIEQRARNGRERIRRSGETDEFQPRAITGQTERDEQR